MHHQPGSPKKPCRLTFTGRHQWFRQRKERCWICGAVRQTAPQVLKEKRMPKTPDEPCAHGNNEGWESLADYLRRTNPLVAALMRDIRRQMDAEATRRTVRVATLKYRARKRRR